MEGDAYLACSILHAAFNCMTPAPDTCLTAVMTMACVEASMGMKLSSWRSFMVPVAERTHDAFPHQALIPGTVLPIFTLAHFEPLAIPCTAPPVGLQASKTAFIVSAFSRRVHNMYLLSSVMIDAGHLMHDEGTPGLCVYAAFATMQQCDFQVGEDCCLCL